MGEFPGTRSCKSLVELLRQRAERQPAKLALTYLLDGEFEEARLTYSELDSRARAVAGRIQGMAAPGDRVLLMFAPGVDFLVAFFGCLYARAVAVPVFPPEPTHLHRSLPRLKAILADAGAKVALTAEGILGLMEEAFSLAPDLRELKWCATDGAEVDDANRWRETHVEETDLAFLQYTSGSTSAPRGVALDHGNLLTNLALISKDFGHCDESHAVIWLPPYHDMGLIGGVLNPIFGGYPVTLLSPLDFLQRPLRWLMAVSRAEGRVTSGGPNFAFDLCIRKVASEDKQTLNLSHWKVAFVGAEPIRAETLRRFVEAFGPCGFREEAFFPCYGLAEATLYVSGGPWGKRPQIQRVSRLSLEGRKPEPSGTKNELTTELVGCGVLSETFEARVVKPDTLMLAAPGEVGELWLRGPSVARGYWNAEALSQQSFGARLEGDGTKSFLRTGDLCVFRDEQLYITGRLKDLLILRGRNLYPQDLELCAEKAHPSVRPGCSAAFAVDGGDQEELVVVVEVDRKTPDDSLNAVAVAVSRALVEQHDVSPHEVCLMSAGAVPKTSSGKVQRHLCKRLHLEGATNLRWSWKRGEASRGPTTPMSTPTEVALAEILKETTHVTQIAREDDLVGLGADSLAVAQLAARIHEAWGVNLGPSLLFESKTVAAIAARIDGAIAEGAQKPSPIAQVDRSVPVLLSLAQQRLWILDQLHPGSPSYNEATILRFTGLLQVQALEQAIGALIARHEPLRTSFEEVEGQPVQRVLEPPPIQLSCMDVSGVDGSLEAGPLKERITLEARSPFDIRAGQVFRCTLFRRSEDEHLLLMVAHHIVCDGWSMGVLQDDLLALYEAAAERRPAALAPLKSQYLDFSAWQREHTDSSQDERQLLYWRNTLANPPAHLELPVDRHRPKERTARGGRVKWKIDAAIRTRLAALGKENGATLYMVLLAAFQSLLSRWSGQEDILVGTPVVGRSRPELEKLIGFFSNTLVMRTRVQSGMTYRQVLAKVRQTTLEALDHQDVYFDRLVQELSPERIGQRTPYFRVLFSLQNPPLPKTLQSGLSVRREWVDVGVAHFDLTLQIWQTEDGLDAVFIYSEDLFDRATVEKMARQWDRWLQAILKQPEYPVARYHYFSNDEQDRPSLARTEWTAPSVVRLLENQVSARPSKVAVRCGEETLTFAELWKQSAALADLLRQRHVTEEDHVATILPRSLDAVIAIVAIWRIGAVYVPVDSSLPQQRIQAVLADARPKCILAKRGQEELWKESSVPVLDVDARLSSGHQAIPFMEGQANRLAYLMYTSGSTGQPRGVMVTHQNFAAFLHGAQGYVGVNPDDVQLHTASFAFSASMRQLFLPLVHGAQVVLASKEETASAVSLLSLVRSQNVTLLSVTPSFWRALIDGALSLAPEQRANLLGNRVRLVMSASERLWSDLPALWREPLGQPSAVLNMLGHTECSGVVMGHPLAAGSNEDISEVPVGRGFDLVELKVCDTLLEQVPDGVIGELVVGGPGISRGYWGDPSLTAERFVPDRWSPTPGARLFRTGDRVRRDSKGVFHYVDRIDFQVKIRGQRLELGEVEAVLRQHPAVRDCAVIALPSNENAEALVAYVVQRKDVAVASFAELRSHLAARLPGYMVPSSFTSSPFLPMTPNGKLDRAALPKPVGTSSPVHTEHIAPATALERVLVSMWEEVLDVQNVGVTDNFFELGGHSLLANRLLSQVQGMFPSDAPLITAFFQDPTIAGLAAAIEATETGAKEAVRMAELLRGLDELTEEEAEKLLEEKEGTT